MRNFKRVTLAGMAMLLMAFTTMSISLMPKAMPVYLPIKPAEVIEIKTEPIKVEVTIAAKSHTAFLEAIGKKESGNNYDIVNTFGYMGKYQFGASTLKGLGYDITREEFLNSPAIQEEAMHKLLLHNEKKLRKFIKKHEGEIVHGVFITESGVLAAAHLAGAGNVRKFFRKGYEFKDGYGTNMTSYMRQFGGYRLNLYGI